MGHGAVLCRDGQDVAVIHGMLVFFYRCDDHRDLHSFPTRRSSDLLVRLFTAELGITHLRLTGGEPLLRADLAERVAEFGDRKSTRLNSSHSSISYAAFCLKKRIDSPELDLYECIRGLRSAAFLALP